MPGRTDTRSDRRALDDPAATRSAAAWRAEVPGLRGIASRRRAEHPVGAPEVARGKRTGAAPALQRAPAPARVRADRERQEPWRSGQGDARLGLGAHLATELPPAQFASYRPVRPHPDPPPQAGEGKMFTFKKPDARPREKSASGVPKCRLHDWWIGPMIRFGTARRDSKMKPSKSILDNSFNYVPSAATAVEKTWRRFGWRPIAEA